MKKTDLPPSEKPPTEWEDRARELAVLLLGDIQYGDTRDNPKWKELTAESATNLIKNLLQEQTQKARELPLGASQWLAHGKKYGYDTYFEKPPSVQYADGDFWEAQEKMRQAAYEKGVKEGYKAVPSMKKWGEELDSIIGKATQAERERIIGIVRGTEITYEQGLKLCGCGNNFACHFKKGYNQSLDDLIKEFE